MIVAGIFNATWTVANGTISKLTQYRDLPCKEAQGVIILRIEYFYKLLIVNDLRLYENEEIYTDESR